MKKKRVLLLFSLIIVLNLLSAIIKGTTNINFNYDTFAVTNNGRILLGRIDGIDIIDYEGNILNTISPETNRGYFLATNSNNEILIKFDDTILIKDTDNNLLLKTEFNEDYEDIFSSNSWEYSSYDGRKFKMKYLISRPTIYEITETEEIILYQMPISQYVFLMIIRTSLACNFILGLIFVIKIFKKTR